MARHTPRQPTGGTTDHSMEVDALRAKARELTSATDTENPSSAGVWLVGEANAYFLAADLLELHDRTGISLDDWTAAREFVERRMRWADLAEPHVLVNGA